MDETKEITSEQKHEWIVQALEQTGFKENTENPGMFSKEYGVVRGVVDLTAGKNVYLYDTVAKTRLQEDDDQGTLAGINLLIQDAEDGKMPTVSEPDMVCIVDAGEPNLMLNQPDTNIDYEPPSKQVHETMQQDHNTALAPLSTTTDIVRPAVSAQQAISAWRDFQDLQKAILEPSDFQKIGSKDFKKKSAWRKFATFFNLNDKIVEETQTQHPSGQGWTWKIKVECQAPNGRITEGVGMCSTSERNFAHVEHDTYATAHTRAKNRAISDMVAAGEVSAEEVVE